MIYVYCWLTSVEPTCGQLYKLLLIYFFMTSVRFSCRIHGSMETEIIRVAHKSQTNGSKVKAKLWIQISNMSAALLVPICTWSWSKYLRNLANLANVCFNEMMYFNYPVVILDKTSTDVLLLFVSSLHISIIIIYVKFKCVPCCLINVIHK